MTRLSDTAIDLLRLLARMPFLDRLEMAALAGRSRGGVYQAAARLEGNRTRRRRAPRHAVAGAHPQVLPH